jgi:hypothetical protein
VFVECFQFTCPAVAFDDHAAEKGRYYLLIRLWGGQHCLQPFYSANHQFELQGQNTPSLKELQVAASLVLNVISSICSCLGTLARQLGRHIATASSRNTVIIISTLRDGPKAIAVSVPVVTHR